jgi:hypothetical protein
MLQNDLPRNRITKNNNGGDSPSHFFFTLSELQTESCIADSELGLIYDILFLDEFYGGV